VIASAAASPRLLGLVAEPIDDFRTAQTRNSRLFRELEQRFPIAGIVHPEMGRIDDLANKARFVTRDRWRWRGRAALNGWRFDHLSSDAEKELQAREGSYDLIFLLQTLFGPGREPGRHRYVVYTDNIYPLTRHHYPLWADLGTREQRRWIAREGEVCRRASRVFTMTEYLRRAMIDGYGCEPERVVTVGAGANAGVDSLAGRSWDSRQALFVGIDFVRKGGHDLLAAWPLVRDQIPDARLTIVGPHDAVADLPAGVAWAGHIADRDRLARMFLEATAFVLPSLFDPCPHVLREAMGYGLPCVTTNVGALPELVADGQTGLVVEPRDPAALAKALVSLLGDPGRAEELGRRAHAQNLEHNAWPVVASRMAPHIAAAAGERL
jgi:glycosyltransferase involved in cell wall biosynthesis